MNKTTKRVGMLMCGIVLANSMAAGMNYAINDQDFVTGVQEGLSDVAQVVTGGVQYSQSDWMHGGENHGTILSRTIHGMHGEKTIHQLYINNEGVATGGSGIHFDGVGSATGGQSGPVLMTFSSPEKVQGFVSAYNEATGSHIEVSAMDMNRRMGSSEEIIKDISDVSVTAEQFAEISRTDSYKMPTTRMVESVRDGIKSGASEISRVSGNITRSISNSFKPG